MTKADLTKFNDEQIQNSFNHVAHDYDNFAVLPREVAARMVARLEVISRNPKIILDIGAATGHLSRLLTKRFNKARVFSLDLAMNMLQQAKKKRKLLSKQRFISAHANHLPFYNNSVDFIIANLMLSWSNNISQTLYEWQRVLKPEGLLILLPLDQKP